LDASEAIHLNAFNNFLVLQDAFFKQLRHELGVTPAAVGKNLTQPVEEAFFVARERLLTHKDVPDLLQVRAL